jgi:hypothetical protein
MLHLKKKLKISELQYMVIFLGLIVMSGLF